MTPFIIHNANVLDVTHVSQVISAIRCNSHFRDHKICNFVAVDRVALNSHHTFQKQCHIV